MRKKTLVVTILGFVGLAIIMTLSLLSNRNSSSDSYIDLLVAPSGSTAKIDGKGVKSGKYKVSEGNHQINVLRGGFTSQSKTVEITGKETRFVGIILTSNSSDTKDWYQEHDGDLVQSINNRVFDQVSEDLTNKDPLLNKLPHIGPGLIYRVDYGIPSSDSKTGMPAIYIRFRTDRDKQAALKWIKDQGSDPSKMDIVYIRGNF